MKNGVASHAVMSSNPRVSATVLKSCLLAARPKTLPAAIVPVWAGCVLAWKLAGTLDIRLAAATLVGAIAIQIATNFFNDAIDARKGADTEKRLGPVRVTSSGLMSRRAVMLAGVIFLLLATACGVVLYQTRGWPVIAIGVPSLFLAYGYTGGPFPLAYRGMGELFVIVFFGLVAVAGTVFMQTGTWPAAGFLLGLQTGLLSAVLISINNLRDREEDSGTGKHTLAVRLGHRNAARVIVLEILTTIMTGVGWFYLTPVHWTLAGVPALFTGWIICRGVLTLPPGPVYNRLLALGGVQLMLFAFALHLLAVAFP
jgi:1,4-dihydroxy-2-naphthoate octaprenyltransferase